MKRQSMWKAMGLVVTAVMAVSCSKMPSSRSQWTEIYPAGVEFGWEAYGDVGQIDVGSSTFTMAVNNTSIGLSGDTSFEIHDEFSKDGKNVFAFDGAIIDSDSFMNASSFELVFESRDIASEYVVVSGTCSTENRCTADVTYGAGSQERALGVVSFKNQE